jgi:hypothetical protein
VSAVKLRGKRTEALRTHLNSPTNFAEDPYIRVQKQNPELRPKPRGWAKLKCRNGPNTVAKRKGTTSAKSPKKKTTVARQGSKTAKVLDLLKRPGGASLKELRKATGWQAHSVRGFLSGALGKKMGLTVTSTKAEDAERRSR